MRKGRKRGKEKKKKKKRKIKRFTGEGRTGHQSA